MGPITNYRSRKDAESNRRCYGIRHQEITRLLGRPQYILSNSNLNFDCKTVEDFARRLNIQRERISTYSTLGTVMVDTMVGYLKKALQQVSRSEFKESDATLQNSILYTEVGRD